MGLAALRCFLWQNEVCVSHACMLAVDVQSHAVANKHVRGTYQQVAQLLGKLAWKRNQPTDTTISYLL